MDLATGMMIDPPEGWAYGFPKKFEPLDGESVNDFLRRHGVPEEIISLGHIRYWEAE